MTINVQCVYGDNSAELIYRCIIPALPHASSQPVHLITRNYSPQGKKCILSGEYNGVTVTDIPNTCTHNSGFAENHNTLFHACPPEKYFILLNPDCIPLKGSIDALVKRKVQSQFPTAIVEGRQWPYEHPKEYNSQTLETPWASGAFELIDAEFYAQVGGMDEIYFLYDEDVDLSWQAWLNGYSVLYEPRAAAIHFSGGKFYRSDLVSNELFMGLRNFLVISRKFFGEAGEKRALKLLKVHPEQEVVAAAIQEYFESFQCKVGSSYAGKTHPMVKILDVNTFHKTRSLC